MGNLFESLKNYFESTPQDVLENDWKEIEYLNEIGPDVIEYAEYVKAFFGANMPISSTHKFDVSECSDDSHIAVDAQYLFAA